jgi:hypothetical protein
MEAFDSDQAVRSIARHAFYRLCTGSHCSELMQRCVYQAIDPICHHILGLYEAEPTPAARGARVAPAAPAAAAVAPSPTAAPSPDADRTRPQPLPSLAAAPKAVVPQPVAPPADPALRATIEQMAATVGRVGETFELTVRSRNSNNPRFCFLFGGQGSAYYLSLLGRLPA